MQQSLKAIKPEGVISIIGFLGGMSRDQPSFLECLNNICTVRGVLVGSRLQFEMMNECIDANGIKPVVDEKVFQLKELKEAYQYMVRNFLSRDVSSEEVDADSIYSGSRSISVSWWSTSTPQARRSCEVEVCV